MFSIFRSLYHRCVKKVLQWKRFSFKLWETGSAKVWLPVRNSSCTAEGRGMVTDTLLSFVQQRLSSSWWASCLLALILYTICSGYSNFINQVFFSQYRYGYPAVLALYQVLLTFLAMRGVRHFQWILINPYSLEMGEKLLIPSICFSFHSVLSLWAYSNARLSPFTFIQRFTPLGSLLLVQLYPIKQRPPLGISIVVILVTVCSIIPGIQNFQDDTLVLIYGLFSLAYESVYLVSVQMIGEERRISAIDFHYICVINSGPILALLCILYPDTSKAFTTGNWHSLLFLGFFSLVVILGSILKFIICFCAWNSTAISVGIMDVAKIDILFLRNAFLYGWNSLSSTVITSFFISITGIGIYVHKLCKAKQYTVAKSDGIVA